MATQTIPHFEPLNNPAIIPVLHRERKIRRFSPVRPSLRKKAPQAQQSEEKQRLLVEMLPLVKRAAFKIREHLPAHVEVDDLIAQRNAGAG